MEAAKETESRAPCLQPSLIKKSDMDVTPGRYRSTDNKETDLGASTAHLLDSTASGQPQKRLKPSTEVEIKLTESKIRTVERKETDVLPLVPIPVKNQELELILVGNKLNAAKKIESRATCLQPSLVKKMELDLKPDDSRVTTAENKEAGVSGNKSDLEVATAHSFYSIASGQPKKPSKPSTSVLVRRKAVQEVLLAPENIKLIKVLIKEKVVDIAEFPCSITCDEGNGKILLEGDYELIRDIATSMRHVAFEMASCTVIQEGTFLCTSRGEQWIAEEFEKLGLPAITYTKDQVRYILAKDEIHLDSVTTIFNEIVSSHTQIMIDDPILINLTRSECNETVVSPHTNCMTNLISDLSEVETEGKQDIVFCCLQTLPVKKAELELKLSDHCIETSEKEGPRMHPSLVRKSDLDLECRSSSIETANKKETLVRGPQLPAVKKLELEVNLSKDKVERDDKKGIGGPLVLPSFETIELPIKQNKYKVRTVNKIEAGARSLQPSLAKLLEMEVKLGENMVRTVERKENGVPPAQPLPVKTAELEPKHGGNKAKPAKEIESRAPCLQPSLIKKSELDVTPGRYRSTDNKETDLGVSTAHSLNSTASGQSQKLLKPSTEVEIKLTESKIGTVESKETDVLPLAPIPVKNQELELILVGNKLNAAKKIESRATCLQPSLVKKMELDLKPDDSRVTTAENKETGVSGKKSDLDVATAHSFYSIASGQPQKSIKTSIPLRPPKKMVKEVILPRENIKLIKVLLKARVIDITDFPCSITCDEENGKVILEGDDNLLSDIASSMRQVAFEMASCNVSQEGGFLCTSRGEQWIAEEFEKLGLPAILYTKDQVTYFVAKQESHLHSVTTAFNKIFSSQIVTFDNSLLPYLESLDWLKVVRNFQAKFMIQMINDFKTARILVKGRREDVDSVIISIKQLLFNEKNKLAPQLPMSCSVDYKVSQPGEASSHPKVNVVLDDIAAFAADVLVNPFVVKKNHLKEAGAVSLSFFKAGGETLQKEFEKVGAPTTFGTDVRVTGPAGTIRAKRIFHAAIVRMEDTKSIGLLLALIKTCLKKAEAEKLTSIAFPTLGCGNLRYSQSDVSRCFAEAMKGSTLQIYIVAYTQELYEKFRNDFMTQEAADFDKSTVCDTAVTLAERMPPTVAPKAEVKPTKIVKTDTEEIIVYSAITQLNSEMVAHIQLEQTNEVQVAIDVTESTITLRGPKAALVEVRQRILKILTEDELLQRNLSYIKKHKGEKAYLFALGSMSAFETPEYWNISGGHDGMPVKDASVPIRLPLVKESPVYNAVELLIKDSWYNYVKGDANSRINVTNIWIVVNQNLFRNYQFKLKVFALRAAERPFKAITDLGEREIITKTVKGTDCISEQLVSEVNEVYLCHGTKRVTEIEKTGIDSRLSANWGLYGNGAYFAESSLKANQYASPISNQDTKESKRQYMFVARVLLGEPFLCKTRNTTFKRPPCCSGCKDSCTGDHPMCDSVVGTQYPFREFIVYHPDQSYPEFLVEYER